VVETPKIKSAREKILTVMQEDLVIGSLLGDEHLVKTTKGYAFRVNHGAKQREYVDWKFRIMEQFTNSQPKLCQNCYYFLTISHPFFQTLRDKFYEANNKRLPIQLIKKRFNPFILAVWTMDDGTKEGRQFRINSHCFSIAENEFLQGILSTKLGINSTLNKDKGYSRIRIKGGSMNRFLELVKPYFIPSMFYKLPL
jgi:recombination protein RecA